MKLILTCEHAGHKIPAKYLSYFKNDIAVLKTHRGFDLGALDVFNSLKPLADSTFFSKTSRLLIELNRSLHHKNLFSDFSKKVSVEEKSQLIKEYTVYRNSVQNAIQFWIDKNETVLHVSVHSFTPVLNDVLRNCDIGLLYDSKKKQEKDFCKYFKDKILEENSTLNIRYNYPYLGKADGFTTHLRKQFPKNYIGIELEINQKYSKENYIKREVKMAVVHALQKIISNQY